jgi:hypothetical protein
LTKRTKYDMHPTYFWLPVVIAEWELGRGEMGNRGIGKWGNGEMGERRGEKKADN